MKGINVGVPSQRGSGLCAGATCRLATRMMSAELNPPFLSCRSLGLERAATNLLIVRIEYAKVARGSRCRGGREQVQFSRDRFEYPPRCISYCDVPTR